MALVVLPALGQAQTVEWARSDGGQLGFTIAVDQDGNSYVAGTFSGTATFGPITLTGIGDSDIFVAKYDASGNVLWARSGVAFVVDGISVDASGNSYVTGLFGGTATFGSITITSVLNTGAFVAKYDASGNVLWARSVAQTRARGRGIAADDIGNTYVTGHFFATGTFDSFTLTGTDGNNFVVQYDTDGNVQRVRAMDGSCKAIAIDGAGNIYITGHFSGTSTFDSITLTDGGMFVVKLDASGNVLWAESVGGDSTGVGFGIGVDGAGNSFVIGLYSGTVTFGSFTLTSAGDRDIAVAKYDTNGNVLWARSAGGPSRDKGFGISVDADGNSYTTGFFRDGATFGPFSLTSTSIQDAFVAKYGSNGDVLWVRSAGGTESTSAAGGRGIAVDAAGNSYVTGGFVGSTTFCPFTLTPDGGMFVAKYTSFAECGNDCLDAGEECDGMADVACPGACQPDCTCGPFCGDGTCDPGEDACTCPADCVEDDCDLNGITDVCEGTSSLTFCVKCNRSSPSDPCSSGTRWSFQLRWPAPGPVFQNLSCGPVLPVEGTTAADMAAAFVDCVNASVCPSVNAAQLDPGRCFEIVVPGPVTPDICVGPFGGPSDACCPPLICLFNPTLVEVEVSFEDCNDNNVDDAIDIVLETSPDNNDNGVPDECEAIPTMSEWGLVVMALLLLVGAKVLFIHRRPVRA